VSEVEALCTSYLCSVVALDLLLVDSPTIKMSLSSCNYTRPSSHYIVRLSYLSASRVLSRSSYHLIEASREACE
jgi:hypothetical protein